MTALTDARNGEFKRRYLAGNTLQPIGDDRVGYGVQGHGQRLLRNRGMSGAGGELAVAEWPRLRVHPAADIFPLLSGNDLDGLIADIAQHGLLHPIILSNGAVLDGRNRLWACEVTNTEPRFVEFDGDDPLAFVISTNLHRRHLSESQRAMVAAKIAKMPQGHRSDLEPSANLPEVVSQPEAAALLNVSERSIRNAKAVQRDGIPQLVEAVETGGIAVSAAVEIARLPQPEQVEAVGQKLANRTSFTGNNEWFTPPEYLALARGVLGRIDLDPATHPEAQKTVKATSFFTEADDGLAQEWAGRVWLNPPYAQPAIGHFADKMVAEVGAGRVSEAIMLTHNYTDTAWFQTLARAATAICFTKGRIRFVSPNGTLAAPTQGQAFFYFGKRLQTFLAHFREVGFVAQVHP